MQNYKLLQLHRKKLATRFAIFILVSIWLIVGMFLGTKLLKNTFFLENKLQAKLSTVTQILKNKEEYDKQISTGEKIIPVLLAKSLEGVHIFENKVLLLGNIMNPFGQSGYFNDKDKLYLQQDIISNGHSYIVIGEIDNNYNIFIFLEEYGYFALFTLPFLFLFFGIAYVFVGKTLKPIAKTISSLEMFNGHINHELKTPLAELISTLGLVEKTKTGYHEAIVQSLGSSRKIQKILDSILGLISFVETGYEKEEVVLSHEIKELIQNNKTEIILKKININIFPGGGKYKKILNKQHLHICIQNILQNAIKYSQDEGKIDIQIERDCITITDNGLGIEQKNIAHIFEGYFRENYITHSGQGLGLALVRTLVDMNNWDIKVESEKAIGTKVCLILTPSLGKE